MKLYSKLPRMKRVRPIDQRSKKVDYKQTFFLHPTDPVEVPDDVANILLKQDPHIVSKEPYSGKEDVSERPPVGYRGNAKEVIAPAKPKADAPTEPEDYEQYIPVLRELSEKGDFSKMELKEIRAYGDLLGLKIRPTLKGDNQRKLFVERVNAISKALEGK